MANLVSDGEIKHAEKVIRDLISPHKDMLLLFNDLKARTEEGCSQTGNLIFEPAYTDKLLNR